MRTLLVLFFLVTGISFGQDDLLINGTPVTVISHAQDAGSFEIQDNGNTIKIDGDAWKKTELNYSVTENTILEFDVRIVGLGEIHGILFDNDNAIGNFDRTRMFQVAGSQNWGLSDFQNYTGTDWVSFRIPVGDFFTGDFTYLVFVANKDNDPDTQQSFYRNIRLFENGVEPTSQPTAWIVNGNDIHFNSGNVGVGTSTPDAPLTIKGRIHAEEVKVDLSVPAPDYVFHKEYRLNTLREVENFIRENGHLPNIPSAEDMERHGVELGNMEMKLLEKIEELTLYVIELNQTLELQGKTNRELHKRLKKMESILYQE
ncbi:hypothetical protein [Ulvibacterium sp.]|uniref:hypothetical protein n=1 Tax=Ulvibacterium sp. TaxID=2665914 RepID=UPI003CC5035F